MGNRLLLISPIFPAADGIGSAKRANVFLDAFASDFDVYLAVIPLIGLEATEEQFISLRRRCKRIHVLPPPDLLDEPPPGATVPELARYADGAIADRLREVSRSVAPDVVHIFKLYLASLAAVFDPTSGFQPRLQIDLDDYESRTHAALAKRLEHRQRTDLARFELTESEHYLWWEDAFIPKFDRVFVASERDRAHIAQRTGLERLWAVPNAIDVPEEDSRTQGDRSFTFLFVGTLDYYPNEDGILWFLEEVLPALRADTPRSFRVRIVGAHPPETVQTLASGAPDVTVTGWVDDIREAYREADAVIAPIHAGGGTRIKILEAFAFHRPVVATSAAVEGIDARDEEHLLIANEPRTFAACCRRLLRDAVLGESMADRALELVRARYDSVIVRAIIRRLTLPDAA